MSLGPHSAGYRGLFIAPPRIAEHRQGADGLQGPKGHQPFDLVIGQQAATLPTSFCYLANGPTSLILAVRFPCLSSKRGRPGFV